MERMASNPWVEGIEAIVFRTVGEQPTLWESILPAELLVLPGELARVDALLDDPAFFAPFAPYFDARIGRPSIPVAGLSATTPRTTSTATSSNAPSTSSRTGGASPPGTTSTLSSTAAVSCWARSCSGYRHDFRDTP